MTLSTPSAPSVARNARPWSSFQTTAPSPSVSLCDFNSHGHSSHSHRRCAVRFPQPCRAHRYRRTRPRCQHWESPLNEVPGHCDSPEAALHVSRMSGRRRIAIVSTLLATTGIRSAQVRRGLQATLQATVVDRGHRRCFHYASRGPRSSSAEASSPRLRDGRVFPENVGRVEGLRRHGINCRTGA